ASYGLRSSEETLQGRQLNRRVNGEEYAARWRTFGEISRPPTYLPHEDEIRSVEGPGTRSRSRWGAGYRSRKGR
ncbi:MAG: hypothetical protein V3S25_05615, partial [Nitrospirales bacterium]